MLQLKETCFVLNLNVESLDDDIAIAPIASIACSLDGKIAFGQSSEALYRYDVEMSSLSKWEASSSTSATAAPRGTTRRWRCCSTWPTISPRTRAFCGPVARQAFPPDPPDAKPRLGQGEGRGFRGNRHVAQGAMVPARRRNPFGGFPRCP